VAAGDLCRMGVRPGGHFALLRCRNHVILRGDQEPGRIGLPSSLVDLGGCTAATIWCQAATCSADQIPGVKA
jgi:hypothetical protein